MTTYKWHSKRVKETVSFSKNEKKKKRNNYACGRTRSGNIHNYAASFSFGVCCTEEEEEEAEGVN